MTSVTIITDSVRCTVEDEGDGLTACEVMQMAKQAMKGAGYHHNSVEGACYGEH